MQAGQGTEGSPAGATIIDGAFPPSRRQVSRRQRLASRARLTSGEGARATSSKKAKRPILLDRRGSAHRQALKHGKIAPSMQDMMLVSGAPLPVQRAESQAVHHADMSGAASHRLWEHKHIDPTVEGLACVPLCISPWAALTVALTSWRGFTGNG